MKYSKASGILRRANPILDFPWPPNCQNLSPDLAYTSYRCGRTFRRDFYRAANCRIPQLTDKRSSRSWFDTASQCQFLSVKLSDRLTCVKPVTDIDRSCSRNNIDSRWALRLFPSLSYFSLSLSLSRKYFIFSKCILNKNDLFRACLF